MTLLFSFLAQPAFAAVEPDLRFVVVGDTQAVSGSGVNLDVWPGMVDDINALAPDLTFFVGDLVNGAGTVPAQVEAWKDWLALTDGLDCDRYMVAGNHDFLPGPGVKEAWAETFEFLPRDNSPAGEEGLTYWFDVGDVRFVGVLSDDDYGINVTPDTGWLESVLADATDKAHVFVFTHHTTQWSASDAAMGGTQGDFWQTLLLYDVDALFAGHWHLYQPGQLGGGAMASGHAGSAETWEIIDGTGGGNQTYPPVRPSNLGYGFTLVEVSGDAVTATFYRDEDGDGAIDDVADLFELTYARTRARGLVAWYPLDADLGDHAPAETGFGLDATALGDAALGTDAERGSALSLDGDGDSLEVSAINTYQLSLKGDLTVQIWGRADALGSGEWDNALVDYGTNDYYTEDEETNYAYWLSVESNGTLRAFWEWGDGTNVVLESTAAAPTDGAWHAYTLVREVATEQVRFYVDGTPLGEPVSFDRLPSGASRGYLYIGADTVDNAGSYWTGALSNLCLYDRPLDDDEIARLAAGEACDALAGDREDTATDSARDSDSAVQAGEGEGESADSGAGETGALKVSPSGCGCDTSGDLAGFLGVGLGLGVLRRRRRGR